MPSGDTAGLIYDDGWQKKLLRRYEINERFSSAFNEAVASHGGGKPSRNLNAEARLRELAARSPVGDVIPDDGPAPAHPLADFGQFRPGCSEEQR
jgi:hypothetical protein